MGEGESDILLGTIFEYLNTEHQLKSNLAWPVCPKSTKLKQNWCRSNDCSKKWRFCWVITYNCYLVGRIDFWGYKNLVGGVYWEGGGGEFLQAGGDEQIFGWWWGLSPSPNKNNPPCSHSKLYGLSVISFSQTLIMYQSN